MILKKYLIYFNSVVLIIVTSSCAQKPMNLGRERMVRACMDQLFQREDCERMIAN